MRYLLLALLFLFAGCHDNHDAAPHTGRYQLVTDGTGNTWWIDTVSGETKKCWQGSAGVVAPQCFTAVQK